MLINYQQSWKSLEKYFSQSINLIHCFDVSHQSGFYTTASTVAFDSKGAVSSQYRYFNITDISNGDDYAALEQAVNKRYRNLTNLSLTPAIILIDGGIGQLNRVVPVINQLASNWQNKPMVFGISKGKSRKVGEEVFIEASSGEVVDFKQQDFYFLLIKIRDASHNYANKKRQDKELKVMTVTTASITGNQLAIPGLGEVKARALLQKYNIKEIEDLTIEQLMSIKGIGRALAEKIFSHFNGKSFKISSPDNSN